MSDEKTSCEAAVQSLFEQGIQNDSEIFRQLKATYKVAVIFEALRTVRKNRTIIAEMKEMQSPPPPPQTDPEVQHLLTQLQQPNIPLATITIRGISPLLYCCSTCDEELGVQILTMQRSLNINEVHDYGYTPLIYALEGSMPLLTKALLDAGANINSITKDLQLQKGSVQSGGRCPLHFAARILGKVGTEMVELLLNAGANPHVQDLDGNTPFILSCMRHGDPSVSSTSLLLLRAMTDSSTMTTSSTTTDPSTMTTPSPEWLLAKVKTDQAAGNKRVQQLWHVPPMLRQVVTIPKLFTQKECVHLQSLVTTHGNEHGWTNERHRGYATTDIRSAKIQTVDGWLREQLTTRLFPLLSSRYGFAINSFSFRDLFFVKYEACEGGQRSCGTHRDGSTISFNVLLNETHEFEGGGTWFDHTNKTHSITQGDFLIHSGKLRHAGTTITSGLRMILVGFVDSCEAGEGLVLHFHDSS